MGRGHDRVQLRIFSIAGICHVPCSRPLLDIICCERKAGNEIMIDYREEVLYIPNSVQTIIEAVVTNNVGYGPIRSDIFRKGTKVTRKREDGTIIRGCEELNLDHHLRRLHYANVIPGWNDEYQRRFPAFTRMETLINTLPSLL